MKKNKNHKNNKMKHPRYISSGKRGFFDEQFRKERLKDICNSLEAVRKVVDSL